MKIDYGYAGKILRVDLSGRKVSYLPTAAYAERFAGGRGIAAKIYWDLVPPHVRPFDPENVLIVTTGPLAGIPGISGSRWQLSTKSPITNPEHYCYSNAGGQWGAHLKLAGYDGLVVEGASEAPVYLVIKDEQVEITDATHLWQKGALTVRETIKGELGRDVRVLATGPAGDNLVRFANVLADGDASGSAGVGAVMGSKKLKAIAVQGTGRVNAADPATLRYLVDRARDTRAQVTRSAVHVGTDSRGGDRFKKVACFGCPGCPERFVYHAEDGTKGKFMCHGSMFYQIRARRYYGEQTEVPFFANRLCDDYGLDTMPIETTSQWLNRCMQAGILNDQSTGLPLSKLGSIEYIEALVKKIAFREGFGDVLSNGPTRAADIVGQGAPALITDYVSGAEQPTMYDPRLYITSAILYAMEPRQSMPLLHEVGYVLDRWLRWREGEQDSCVASEVFRRIAAKFWGSELAADFSTYEGKALAAKNIQDRQYAKECLILCDFDWPRLWSQTADDHVGDTSLEGQIYTAVTGQEIDETGLLRLGEQVFNLQRAVMVREGWQGRECDRVNESMFKLPLKTPSLNPECWVPGANGEPIQKTGSVLEREQFEAMKSEYYRLRGWDEATGLQTASKLEELGLGDIAADMAKQPERA